MHTDGNSERRSIRNVRVVQTYHDATLRSASVPERDSANGPLLYTMPVEGSALRFLACVHLHNVSDRGCRFVYLCHTL